MKKPLFYALHKGFFGWEVLAITMLKTHRYWGRTLIENTTNGRASDIYGRFANVEAAKAAAAELAEVSKAYELRRRPHKSAIAALNVDEQNDINHLLRKFDGTEKIDVQEGTGREAAGQEPAQ